MAKGLYIYDPGKKEFVPRNAGRPWAMDDQSAIASLDAADRVRRSEPRQAMPAVNPTPIRHRRRLAAVEEDGGNPSKTWRWTMWALIAVMAVTWVVMIGKQVLQTRDRPQGERFFRYDDDRPAAAE